MDGWYSYSEKRRNDPELRKKVEQVLEKRQHAFQLALYLVTEAKNALDPFRGYTDDALFDRNAKAVSMLHRSMLGDARLILDPHSETYIGNLAAGRLGEQIEKMGDAFRP